MAAPPRRAEPPRSPSSPPAQLQAEADDRIEHEAAERRSMVRGLVMLAVLVLSLSIARAGLHRVFPHGWWRP